MLASCYFKERGKVHKQLKIVTPPWQTPYDVSPGPDVVTRYSSSIVSTAKHVYIMFSHYYITILKKRKLQNWT